jgi:tellurite resistance protein
MFQRLLRPRVGENAADRGGLAEDGLQPAIDRIEAGGETTAIRQIVTRLEALPPARARFLAGFAYVMSRAAQADFQITDAETRLMESALVEHGGLDEAQAILVVEMAKLEARRNGATADYLVTREFARLAGDDEKLAVLRCCFLVSAADQSISAEEASVVNEIARELQVEPHDLNRIRAEFVEQLSAIQALRRLEREGVPGGESGETGESPSGRPPTPG